MAQGYMSKPIVRVFAGPNGSGKSTITKTIPICGDYINPDELANNNSLTTEVAANVAEKQRYELIDKNADLTYETVFSTDRHLNFLKYAKSKGYEVQCYYILTCNPDINVARVKSRVHAGGHDVDEEKIRIRYDRALKLLPQVIDVCDRIYVIDNSLGANEQAVIFQKDEDGISYFPNELWSLEELKKLLRH
jgi:predicted ABC-type ATPase